MNRRERKKTQNKSSDLRTVQNKVKILTAVQTTYFRQLQVLRSSLASLVHCTGWLQKVSHHQFFKKSN